MSNQSTELAASATGPAAGATVPAGEPGRAGVPVSLVDLRRSFGGVHALDGMNLHIAGGELVVLLGPSGCGKTTALRVLAGLEDADSGSIVVGGRDVSGVPTNKRDMGMVFQAYSLFPHMTARENVAFGLQLRGMGGTQRRRVAGEYLELVGLSDQADRYANQLSGGQQQRVALARALAIRPKVLLLDEPLSALDAKVRVQLRDEIRRIQLEIGTTTLFVTHDQEEALAVADRVGVMRDGHIEQIDAPDVMYGRPATAFVAEFIGLTNKLPAVASGGSASVLGCPVPLLPGSPGRGSVTVLVRPEAVRLTPDAAAGGPGGGVPAAGGVAGGDISAPTAIVAATSFLGAHGRVQARMTDGTLLLAQDTTAAIEALSVGDRVSVRIDPVPALAVAADGSGG